jgi:hypothetical protein
MNNESEGSDVTAEDVSEDFGAVEEGEELNVFGESDQLADFVEDGPLCKVWWV